MDDDYETDSFSTTAATSAIFNNSNISFSNNNSNKDIDWYNSLTIWLLYALAFWLTGIATTLIFLKIKKFFKRRRIQRQHHQQQQNSNEIDVESGEIGLDTPRRPWWSTCLRVSNETQYIHLKKFD